jgi:hypothetical protein
MAKNMDPGKFAEQAAAQSKENLEKMERSLEAAALDNLLQP